MGRKEVIFINNTELIKVSDSIVEAIKIMIDYIKKVLNDISNCYSRIIRLIQINSNKISGTSPREFGISLLNRKRKDLKYTTYRCVKKIKRNLPYQRRQY